MQTRSGYLTIYSDDKSEIYGEFVDGKWETEETEGGTNHTLSGIASEGTLDTFRRINTDGIDHVAYLFESNGYRYGGKAQLLAPSEIGDSPLVRIETGEPPTRV